MLASSRAANAVASRALEAGFGRWVLGFTMNESAEACQKH
jgi:hypothetical protein